MTVSDTDVELTLKLTEELDRWSDSVNGHIRLNNDLLAEHLVRWFTDALSAAGRLVPEGSETREEWRVQFDYTDGTAGGLMTGNEDEALAAVRAHAGCAHGTTAAQRKVVTTPWSPVPEEKP